MILDHHTFAHRLFKIIFEHGDLIDIKNLILKSQRMNINLNYLEYHGQSLIHLCCLYNRLDLIKFFVEHANCALFKMNDDGWLPLHIAIYLGYMDIVFYFFEYLQTCTFSCS